MHKHPCQCCGTMTPCCGDREENYDGWPDVICRSFHLPSGETNPDFLCVDCETLAIAAARAELETL